MAKIVFPLPQGVAMLCDDKECVSVVDTFGQRKLVSFKTKNKVIFWNFPFLRGIQYMFCGIILWINACIKAFDMCKAKKKKEISVAKNIALYIVFALCAMIFSSVFFGLLPSWIGFSICGVEATYSERNLIILVARLVFFVLFMFSIRILPAVNDIFKFNCVAMKICSGAKRGRKKNKKEIFYPNFLSFLVFCFVFNSIVIILSGARFGAFFNFLFNIAVFFVSVGVCFEICFFFSNVFDEKVKRVLGFLVYENPTKTHIDAVMIANEELDLLKKGKSFMDEQIERPYAVVFNEVRNKLVPAGVVDKSDAEWIIAIVLGKKRGEAKFLKNISDKEYNEIMQATERRANGESVDNIFGWTEFYGLKFDVNKNVLTPRMETEILVELVLKSVQEKKNCTILDVGTGSGAIAISLAKNCDAKVTAIDISKSALAVAQKNAEKNNVKIEFICSNLFENLKKKRKFDIIVSNPPYIPTADIQNLDKNVKECDPLLALDGGEDGLDFYRKIVVDAKNRLFSKGQIFFEVGEGQSVAVKKLLKENGYEDVKIAKDYNKIERIVYGRVK